jgi:hypothetical protein
MAVPGIAEQINQMTIKKNSIAGTTGIYFS